MKIKACIFDMDGTLANSIMDITFSMNVALNRLGYKQIELHKFNNLVGRGFDQFVKDTLKELKLNPSDKAMQEQIYREFVNEYGKNLAGNTMEYDGITPLFKKLNSLQIPIGILSNKNHEELIAVVKNLFSDINFFEVRGYSSKFPPKPDSSNALDMIIELNLKPEEIAYIGDSDVDMITAINSGFVPIGVSWGFRSVEELKENGAKFILNKPSELLDIIK